MQMQIHARAQQLLGSLYHKNHIMYAQSFGGMSVIWHAVTCHKHTKWFCKHIAYVLQLDKQVLVISLLIGEGL